MPESTTTTTSTTATTTATTTSQQKSNRHVIASGLLFALVALIGVFIVLYAWNLPPFHSALQTTENAQVRGQVTIIGPQLSGYIVEVDVQDYQMVRQGQLLMRIDDRIYRQRLDQAQAQLATQRAALANFAQSRRTASATIAQNEAAVANAAAQARRANADLRRVEELAADGSLSARERDAARATRAQTVAAAEQARAAVEIARQNLRTVEVNHASLEAAVANAEAAVRLAEIDLANTRIVAPRDGQLGQISVRLGAFVNAGAQLTALVPQTMWVVANMKETQMADVRLGQPVTFTVDALNHATLRGHVEQIAPATGSEFSVIVPDNATGNFVKIAQRIPVRISIDPDQALAARLRPGMSVVASIDTKAAAASRRAGPSTPGAAHANVPAAASADAAPTVSAPANAAPSVSTPADAAPSVSTPANVAPSVSTQAGPRRVGAAGVGTPVPTRTPDQPQPQPAPGHAQ
jgi:multidrug resistance efflux pump